MEEELAANQAELARLLGGLERAIMNIVWARGEVTVREVWTILHQHRKLAYTTVMTVMSRLADKGVLATRKQGKTFYYQATATPSQFVAQRAQRAVDDVIANFGDVAIAMFLRNLEGMSPERIAALQHIVAKEESDAN